MHLTKNLCRPVIQAFMLATLVSCASTPEQEISAREVKPVLQPSAPVKISIQQRSEPTPEEALEIHTVDIPYKAPAQTDDGRAASTKLCEEIGSKLGSVSIDDCLQQQLIHSDLSLEGRSLAYRDFPPLAGKSPLGRVLVIGGIHGDEFSSVSILFLFPRNYFYTEKRRL